MLVPCGVTSVIVGIGDRSTSAEVFPTRNLRASSSNLDNALNPAMLTWRRTFATSVARLGSSTTPGARPPVLRCAQILQASKDGPCALEDQEIKINGFVRSVRKQKRFAFAEISDGSTVAPLQAILKPAQAAEYAPAFPNGQPGLTRLSSLLAYLPELQSRYLESGKLVRRGRSRPMNFKQQTWPWLVRQTRK